MKKSMLQKFEWKYILNELNQVPDFNFQTALDLIDCNSLFGKSKGYEKLDFEDIVEVDGVRRFISCASCKDTVPTFMIDK